MSTIMLLISFEHIQSQIGLCHFLPNLSLVTARSGRTVATQTIRCILTQRMGTQSTLPLYTAPVPIYLFCYLFI